MVEETDLRNNENFVMEYFTDVSNTAVSMIRTRHFNNVHTCFKQIEQMKNLGFKVCLNIMQIGNYVEKDIIKLILILMKIAH